ncbi:MAG TPA: class I SAM-dependent methyltransferase [Candidatus Angelobacter sp.]|nr:class I SAM-dependent methyltransferase [Candidatus Angelobacter sp.]
MTVPACRLCAAPLTHTFLDLGAMPLANSFLRPEQLASAEPRYPLHARVCDNCLLVQVDAVVSPREIFEDYAYFSSYSSSWVEHARRFAQNATRRLALDGNSLVVEVASNDGYLLKHFVALGIPCRGIEPARNVAAVAEAAGVPTEVCFLGRDTGAALRARGLAADLLVANNVLAHVPDLHDFVAGLAALLKSAGTLSIEFPHLLRLIQEVQFDTIYHEHFCYFSLAPVERLLSEHGLRVFDIEQLPTHGGSLRVLAAPAESGRAEGPGLAAVRTAERAAGLDKLASYSGFGPKVRAVCAGLTAFLETARGDGKKVVAYGAAAKGNTLLNACRIGPDHIAFAVDASAYKQGRYTPGSHLEIRAPEAIAAARPDYLLILPWNLRDELLAKLAFIRAWGGRFVLPIPHLQVLP